ncbi:MAG: LPXTG cell wall anchor domain-containing protein, partial [Oscillospiraceae bacterium]|nr:LPXTG cell wall anchor domain-containing protein [Oscillospiraceae bacterium]
VEREQVGPDVIITATPPPGSGYDIRQPDGPNGPIYIYITVTFNAGDHGTFAGPVDYVELEVRRGTELAAADVPTPIANSEGRPFADAWTPSNPVGHEVVAEITFTATYGAEIHVSGEYGDDGEIEVTVNLPPGDYDVTVEDDTIIIVIPDEDEDDVTVTFPPGWNVEKEQDGPDVIITVTPPPGYELEQIPEDPADPEGPQIIVIYITVTFDAGNHGTFAGSVDYTELRVRRETVIAAGQVPTPIPNSTGRLFTGWAPSNPVGHTVVAAITFIALYEGDIHINGEYGDDGEIDVTVNLPPGDYDVTVEDDRIIVVIPDADEDDITVTFPPGWTYETEQDGDDVIVTIVPPPNSGYELEQQPDGTIVIYVPVRFESGAHGNFAPGTSRDLRVRRGTVLTAANVPVVVANSDANVFSSWTPSEPVGHTALRAITFVAQWVDGHPGYRLIRIYYYVYGEDGELERDTMNNAAGRSYLAPVGSTFSTSNVLDRNNLNSDNVYVFVGWNVYVNGVLRMNYISDIDVTELRTSFTVPSSNEVPAPLAAELLLEIEALNVDNVVGGTIQLIAVWELYEAEEETTPPKRLPQTGIENGTLLWASLLIAVLMLGLGAIVLLKKRNDIFDNVDKR